MSFRNRKFSVPKVDFSDKFKTTCLRTDTTSSDGISQSVVSLESSSYASLPNVEDYTLEKLLNANVPLDKVTVNLDSSTDEENISHFVNSLKIDSHED